MQSFDKFVSPLPAPAFLRHQDLLYVPLDTILVRTPRFPIENYLAYACQITPYEIDATRPSQGKEIGLDQKQSPHPHLITFFQNPAARQALVVGSIDLFDELERSLSANKTSLYREQKLLRYLIRMTTRPTPYGCFAGVALAHWGEISNLSLAPCAPSLHMSPDMGWLLQLIWKIEALPAVQPYLHFQANSALTMRRGRIFLEEGLPSGRPRSVTQVSMKATGVAIRALSIAHAPVLYTDLLEMLLASTPGATLKNVEALLKVLWQHTFLLTDLRPPLTGCKSPAHYLADRVALLPPIAPVARELQDYLQALTAWANLPPEEESMPTYRNLVQRAKEIDYMLDELHSQQKKEEVQGTFPVSSRPKGKGEKEVSSHFQHVDMAFDLAGKQITRSLGEEIAAAAQLLLNLSPLPDGYLYLATYRRAFLERYGEYREIPLLELLDSQIGLGLPAHYVDRQASITKEKKPQSVREQVLLNLALTALRDRQSILHLDEKTFLSLEPSHLALETAPPSLDIYVLLATSSLTALNKGQFHLIIGPNGGTQQAGRTLARFSNLLGAEATEALRRTASTEEALTPGSIWAELVYMPRDSRLANVLLRPNTRRYEILYGVSKGTSSAQIIPLKEIVIGVRNKRFYARWTAKQCDLIVSSGHMLDPLQAPAIARFLSDLSQDQTPQLRQFHWGEAEGFPFLPRVQTGRTILRLAQWRIHSSFHLNAFALASTKEFLPSLRTWREKWSVPRYVYLGEFDHRLLLDLECQEQAEILRMDLQKIKQGKSVVLQEGLPEPRHAWLEGPEGHYMPELVISLALRQPRKALKVDKIATSTISLNTFNQQRLYPPGSEWLYVKLYCAPSLQNDLIAGPIRTFAQEALKRGLAEDWYFLRYADPDPHIRVRFRGNATVLMHQLTPELSRWATQLMMDGPCLKFTFDVYEREIERYGGPGGMLAAEAFFAADSITTAEFLYLLSARIVTLERIVLAVLSIDTLLAQLGLTPVKRLQWCRERAQSRSASGAAYRHYKAQLRALLGAPAALSTLAGGEHIEKIFSSQNVSMIRIAQQLAEAASQQELSQSLTGIYSSFVHMHCNRLLGLKREEEQMAYHLHRRIREGLEKAPLVVQQET